jgi:hypothetical protein
MADQWRVLDYEVQMFNGLLALCHGNIRNSFPWPIPNAITESLLLHARILVDILLSRGRGDDIKLDNLLPGFDVPEIDSLRTIYGKDDKPNSICWTLNKRLAHATTARVGTEGHDYTGDVMTLRAFINAILAAVEEQRPR